VEHQIACVSKNSNRNNIIVMTPYLASTLGPLYVKQIRKY